jgi:regulatory protein
MKSLFMDESIIAKLYKYCAYQDRCTSEVEQKLVDYEVPPDQQAAYLVHLEAERFLDDARYARSIVRGKHLYKGWGRIKIRHELRRKGIAAALIDAAFQQELDPVAYQAKLTQLAHDKWQQWSHEAILTRKDKTSRFLAQKGYDWQEIYAVLEDLEAE